MSRVEDWFRSRGWTPDGFQRKAWAAYSRGESGLIHSSTGSGKTYAAFLGAVEEALADPPVSLAPLTVLWITPLRALASDIAMALELPVRELNLPWDVGLRTGDTSSSQRAKQKQRLPSVLVTTPESLALFLSHADAGERFRHLKLVVADEWHELFGSKRGVLAELALARLKAIRPGLRVWGLSATLGNMSVALDSLMGATPGRIVSGPQRKEVVIDAILPPRVERFPWAGHIGLTLVPQVVSAIDEGRTALVFTNTRAQTEIWYRAILAAKPEWAGLMALHHGSLERSTRDWVEDQLRAGSLRCVVCTSTLDLGVDFSPVDRLLQIGSPKGIARLLQRAGRSGHQPGQVSRITCVPTNALELIEISAARAAAMARTIEAREPIPQPLDVLAQHAVTLAVGGGFDADELYREVTTTHAYRDLTSSEWAWLLDFITRGGSALAAYADFRRVAFEAGRYTMTDPKLVRRHRMAIGTIAGDASVSVRFVRGGRLGTVEEAFASRLQPGDRFSFAGRTLEMVRLREMTLEVKATKQPPNSVPRWMGGRMPLSSELSEAVRGQFALSIAGDVASPELNAVKPILEVQAAWSCVPGLGELLVERLKTREGHHCFVYPFEGRMVHEGLAALAAFRLGRRRPQSFSFAVNDYGFELLSPTPIDVPDWKVLLAGGAVADDLLETLNAAEIAKRQFREVARVAGLVHPGMPHAGRSARQLQASATLFFNVFREYDPGNLLLWQAQREVLDRQLEFRRLEAALARIRHSEVVVTEPPKPTPLAFPLLVDRLRESLSSEKLADRVKRMLKELEAEA